MSRTAVYRERSNFFYIFIRIACAREPASRISMAQKNRNDRILVGCRRRMSRTAVYRERSNFFYIFIRIACAREPASRISMAQKNRNDRIWTCDPHHPKVVRYQAALRPDYVYKRKTCVLRGCATPLLRNVHRTFLSRQSATSRLCI